MKREEIPGGWSLVAVFAFTVGWILHAPVLAAAETRDISPPIGAGGKKVVAAVRELKSALSIRDEIQVALVEKNPRLVSIERAPGGHGFLLLFDKGFLADLESDEIRGAVAHELGHVWIFNHHPFLQTEKLANQQALKIVSRECLRRVYEKASKRGEELSFLKGALD